MGEIRLFAVHRLMTRWRGGFLPSAFDVVAARNIRPLESEISVV